MRVSDTLPFLRAWINNPLRAAAVAPSGNVVATLMTQDISPETGPVVELGPGTGAFTRALLGRGVREQDLTLVEHDRDFARLLRRRFPLARVLWLDAARLADAGLSEEGLAGAVLSRLGIMAMPPQKMADILGGAFACMRPGGAFYQLAYGPRCPVPRSILDDLALEAACIGRTMLHFPPAAVYRIARRRSPRLALA